MAARLLAFLFCLACSSCGLESKFYPSSEKARSLTSSNSQSNEPPEIVQPNIDENGYLHLPHHLDSHWSGEYFLGSRKLAVLVID